MYKKLILFLSLVIIFEASGQDSLRKKPVSLLLYYGDSTKVVPLNPFIETFLKELKYSNKELIPVYSDVTSLNNLYENRRVEGKIIDAFMHADKQKTILENSELRNVHSAEIAKRLLNYDKFLVIRTQAFNSLIEYQFLMYDVVKQTDFKIKDIPILKDYRSTSVFIDPKSPNYKDELIFALKQVCSEVNEKPKSDIRVNGKIAKNLQDTVFVAIQDTIHLEGIAIDPDSPKERFTYTWSLDRERLYGQISYGKEKQVIVLDTPCVFSIGLIIGDGISQSDSKKIIVSVISRPNIGLETSGNAIFWDLIGDPFSRGLKQITDDSKKETSYSADYLFHKSLFGNKSLLWGDDSMVVYFSKGNLRLASTTVTDADLESSFIIRRIDKDSLDAKDTSKVIKKGNYAIIHLYPERKLNVGSYYYRFYATDKGIKSSDLNVVLNFVRVRQFAITNEYILCWLGAHKGFFVNPLIGINWQPFPFINFSFCSSFPFASTQQVKNHSRDYLQTGNVNGRISVELMKSDNYQANRFAIHMQQFDITNPNGNTTRDYIWGIGWRQNFSLLSLGTNIDIIGSYNYFPNLQKKVYMSGVGMFEFSLGFNYHFFKRKKKT